MESPMAVVSAGTVATLASWRTLEGKMHGVKVGCFSGEGPSQRTQDGGRCPVSCSHRSSQKWLHCARTHRRPRRRVSAG